MRKSWIIVPAVGALMCLGGGVVIAAMASSSSPDSVDAPEVSSAHAPVMAHPKETKHSGVGPGTYQVGKTIKAGKWTTPGATGGLCYWHTAPDTSTDHIKDQGVTSGADEAGYVTLTNGQYFVTKGCKSWTPVKP